MLQARITSAAGPRLAGCIPLYPGSIVSLSTILLACCLAALCRASVPDGPVIAEFLAQNQNSIRDQDGDASDWIEIWNAGESLTNLVGWALTDNPANLAKWRFPDSPLGPNQRLLVFASDKNRTEPGSELHTNFKLDAGGEYLALVTPAGRVVSEWANYPVQAPDMSYGPTPALTSAPPSGPSARFRVPGATALNDGWTSVNYDDAQWALGVMPLGFDTDHSFLSYNDLVLSEQPLLYWSFDEQEGPALNRVAPSTMEEALVAQGSAKRVPSPFRVLGHTGSVNGADGSRFLMSRLAMGKDVTGPFAIELWFQTSSPADPTYFMEGATVNGTLNSPGLITGFTGPRLELFGSGGRTGNDGPLMQDTNWHHVVFGYFGSGAGDGVASRQEVWVDGVRTVSRDGNFQSPLVFGGGSLAVGATLCCGGLHGLEGQIDEVAVHSLRSLASESAIARRIAELSSNHWAAVTATNFGLPFSTDLSTAMLGKSTSVQIRLPFVVTNRTDFNQLALRARYDDGIAVWLNGVQVLTVNAPPNLQPDSTALTNRAVSEALAVSTYDLSEHLNLLVDGTNILSLQGLNASLNDPDFMLGFELALGEVRLVSSYFVAATPGAANSAPLEQLGPSINEVTENPAQPDPAIGLAINARVRPTLHPLSHASLLYRVMHGPEVEVPMRDDGAAPDKVSRDGIFTAKIPPGTFKAGEMVRWAVKAWDIQGVPGRAPPNPSGIESSRYFGTVGAGGNMPSGVPVLEWFLQPGMEQMARTREGTRACVFYDDEFYDNVLVQLRGATAAGLEKNPYDFRFNPDHEFRYARGYPRVKRFALNTTWRDKAYVRQVLCFDFFRDAGVPGSVAFPVEVRRNNEFFSLAIFVEIPGKEYLARNGLDPEGALYKADLNGFTMAAQGGYRPAASGFEKKEPEDSDFSDILQFVRGLQLRNEELTRFVFDNVDLPGQINYMAASVVLQDADRLVTNFYPYRDTHGTGEWRMLPWDMDLTLGQANNSIDEVQATQDSPNGVSHPFYGSRSMADYRNPALWNRLIDVIVSIPVFREMYLRRLRTLMDEYLKPAAGSNSELYFEPRIGFWRDRLRSLAEQDRQKWSFWGQRQTLDQALDLIEDSYLPARRNHLFTNHNVERPGYRQNAGIPSAQSIWPSFRFGLVELQAPENLDAESFQIVNVANEAWDISGWRITGGVEFTFKPGTVVPSGTALNLARDVRSFRAREAAHGRSGGFVQGNFSGRLSGWGERLELRDRQNRVWAKTNTADEASLAQQSLRIAELMYHPDDLGDSTDRENGEFLELTNIGAAPLDLRGLRFTQGILFNFDDGAIATLGPGERLLLVRDAETFRVRYGDMPVAGEYQGNLSNGGERIVLVDANGAVIQDFVFSDDWHPLSDGRGYSLEVTDENCAGSALMNRSGWKIGSYGGTPGKAASGHSPGAVPGQLVFAEVMYHPIAQEQLRNHSPVGETAELLAGRLLEERLFEYVLLRNAGTTLIAGHTSPDARFWRVQGAVDFTLPLGFALDPGETVVVVGFDPVSDASGLAAFRSAYPWSSDLTIWGPWTGQLNNAGERLELMGPPGEDPNSVMLLDVVDYAPGPPWPPSADGLGLSLVRANIMEPGDEAEAWVAAAAGSGELEGEKLAPQIVAEPQNVSADALASVSFFVGASGGPQLRYQWLFNEIPLPGATNSNLDITSATALDSGEYSVLVYNDAGSILSGPARLSVYSDLDNDSLPDAWMVEHFGHPLAAESDSTRTYDDFDQDGMSNMAEFIAGTLPNDPDSSLRLQAMLVDGTVRLSFMAAADRTYTLQFSGDPQAGDWENLADLPSRKESAVVLLSDTITNTNRFYRLITPRLP